MANYWLQVNARARVWSNTKETHKMGWLNPGDQIYVVEEYASEWRRFDSVVGGAELVDPDTDYPERWARRDELAGTIIDEPQPAPEPGPLPEQPGDAQLGAAVRILIAALRGDQ